CAGRRSVPHGVRRCGGDAVGTGAARRLPHLHLLALGIEAADDAALTGEPQHALLVEHRRVEVGVGRAAVQLPDLHAVILAVDAGDGVLATFGHPGRTVGPDHHAVRRGTRAELDRLQPAVARIEQDQRAVALAGGPHRAVGIAGDVVQARARGSAEGADAITVELAGFDSRPRRPADQ